MELCGIKPGPEECHVPAENKTKVGRCLERGSRTQVGLDRSLFFFCENTEKNFFLEECLISIVYYYSLNIFGSDRSTAYSERSLSFRMTSG